MVKIWLIGAVSLAGVAAAGASELARISGPEPGAVTVRGFSLSRAGEVEIEAVGLAGPFGSTGGTAAWVLDAASRKMVWEMRAARPVAQARRSSRYRQRVRLAAGDYELHYAVRPGLGEGDDDAVERFVDGLFGASVPREDLAALGATVRGEGRPMDAAAFERARERHRRGLLADLAGLGDGVLESRGFTLAAPAEVEVYAVGELFEDWTSDVGWIVDADRRRVVWELTWENSEHAGGGDGNRTARARLRLPAGRYAATFVTDAGHSSAGWYNPPPHDPAFWGLTVRCVESCAGAAPADLEHLPRRLEVAAVTGLGDGERRELPFSLGAPARLWLYALGEGDGGEMVDRAWIEDAASGEPVWAMDYERTRPAGGAAKNRLADEVVELPAGRYLAVYETDGSHSSGGGWNAEPPAEPERWGLTILVPEGGLAPR